MGDGPAEYGLDPLQYPARLVGRATRFYGLHCLHHITGFQVGHGPRTQRRKNVVLKRSLNAAHGDGLPSRGLVRQPVACHSFESVAVFVDDPGLLLLADLARVLVVLEQLAGLASRLPGHLQTDVGIHAESQALFFSGKAVLHAPVAPARLGDFKIEAQAV